MNVAILKETLPGENRVAAIPATVKEMVKNGMKVLVESGAGENSHISNDEYKNTGAEIVSDRANLLTNTDLILKVAPAELDEIDMMKDGTVYVSFFQTTIQTEHVKKLVNKNISAFSMHLIPRTTLAQSMDALSSQSNIAGYKAVLLGAAHLSVYMPLLMTAAGTIPPAKVLILGAGVAGLQAIATAKRLGAQVEAFDVRPVVKEQVESLGAKFVEVESDEEDGVGEGGYAKETSEDYKQRQQQLIKEHIAKSDMVITTALIPGRPAPVLIPDEMVQGMKHGSVIMDLAAENGGNCELTTPDEVTISHGVIIDGSLNLPATMPTHASQLYAKNIITFVKHLCPEGEIKMDLEDEIISGALFAHRGEITHEPTKEALNKS
ncbi:MAG: Re/Si-specific NAD(P)(+) transhydrogenase subunit alpha [Candidatus Marinimicrobia bacterium]|jgi:NAD(P) transhydrogenase subunit alpha|nr:NAD(P)(+) transhydrogenase (Re/Si-specific) subunit alpha [Candidatus Neomarinimicrobiota bacterium]MDP6500529.1 Re/Si-specific NAD(P)(+) transhydrogenase subunit alpha [Candidatus Neomarinimicrobiota bacterium]MDP6726362.1 Re/Si-specific NAD(P)(+) transhydrogenase subunit alpha [Candidatus Neomarinimicrobiota bacterium]|tara:strand:- start:5267 stop:6403 length:1137 start_codon:yes stop_codon:yes gene_type:complete